MNNENNKVSRIELLTRELCDFLLPYEIPVYNYRPDWLKNPYTGCNLEIDIFYDNLCLGIEVNSKFHDLHSQKIRDKLKYELCTKEGIILITVRTIDDLLGLQKRLQEVLLYKNVSSERIPTKLYWKIKKYKPSKKAFDGKKVFKIERQKKIYRKKKKKLRKEGILLGLEKRYQVARTWRGIIRSKKVDKKPINDEQRLEKFADLALSLKKQARR